MRGSGGWDTIGGCQVPGGGGTRGGPAYSGSGAVGGDDSGRAASAPASGRRQYASSCWSSAAGELTSTDGTQRRAADDGCGAGLLSLAVDILDDPERGSDGDREVDFDSDEAPLIPEQTRDDTERGWGERDVSNDERLLEDRPPHWD